MAAWEENTCLGGVPCAEFHTSLLDEYWTNSLYIINMAGFFLSCPFLQFSSLYMGKAVYKDTPDFYPGSALGHDAVVSFFGALCFVQQKAALSRSAGCHCLLSWRSSDFSALSH